MGTQFFWRPNFSCDQNIFGGSIFLWAKIFLGTQFCGDPKFSGATQILFADPKFCCNHIFWGPKFLSEPNFFGDPNLFGGLNFFVAQIFFRDSKSCWGQFFLVEPNFFGDQIFLGDPFFCKKIFLGTQIFLDYQNFFGT